MTQVNEEQSLEELQQENLLLAEGILGYTFKNKQLLISAITHPSATEGKPVTYSYERLEFLGDAILGAIVSNEAFHRFPKIDEGGLTRIKVSLVAGSCLSDVAQSLGFASIIIFGHSESGTHGRGLHSALENVYEAVVAALFLDGGMEAAKKFVVQTLVPRMSIELAQTPTNPKSELQERLQEGGITPVYKIIETQGPPHDRTFVSQVYAGDHALAQGTGRSKKEAESQAAKSTLARLSEFFGLGLDDEAKAAKEASAQKAKEKKAEQRAEQKAQREAAARRAREKKAEEKAVRKRTEFGWESDLAKVSASAAAAREIEGAGSAESAGPGKKGQV